MSREPYKALFPCPSLSSVTNVNLCAALCSATKTTANITKTTENDRGGKENKEISKKEICSYIVSDLAYSAGTCVEQLHLFLCNTLNYLSWDRYENGQGPSHPADTTMSEVCRDIVLMAH